MEELGNPDYANIVVTDSSMNASFIIMPINFGIKFYGKKRQFYNLFRLGLDAFFYTVSTENGVIGTRSYQTIQDLTVYVSYEIGWNIELFPNREWRVKPTIDIGLLEIGYYIRPWSANVYNAFTGGIGALLLGTSNINIPSWDNLPNWAKILSNFRIGLFPRIGFSIRF